MNVKLEDAYNNILKRIIIVSKYGIYYLFLRDFNEKIYLYNKYSFIIKLNTLGKDKFIRNNNDLIMIYKPKIHELFNNTILDIILPNKKQLLVNIYDLKSKELIIVNNKGFNNGTFQKMQQLNYELLKLDKAALEQGKDKKRKSTANNKKQQRNRIKALNFKKQFYNQTEILNRQSLPLQLNYKKKVRVYFSDSIKE